jgi:anti-anti-sigma factor
MPELKPPFHSYDRDGIWVLPLTGEFDLANSAELEASIAAALERGQPLIIDFSLVEYIDSTVLSALARQKKRAGEQLLVVVPRQTHLRRVFEVTGLHRHLAIDGTLAEALDKARQRGEPAVEDA